MDYDEKARLAQNKGTSPKVLDKLSKDKNWPIRSFVAKNSRSSSKTLKKLSQDMDYYVRICVARNTNTSLKILNRLSQDHEADVRLYTINNNNLIGSVKEMARIKLEVQTKVNLAVGSRLIAIYEESELNISDTFLKNWEKAYFYRLS